MPSHWAKVKSPISWNAAASRCINGTWADRSQAKRTVSGAGKDPMSEPLAHAVKTEQGSYYEIPALRRAGLAHGFSCRDLQADGSQPEQILAGALGIECLTPARLRQRHTALVHQVGPGTRTLDPPPEGDALLSLARGIQDGFDLRIRQEARVAQQAQEIGCVRCRHR